MRHAYEYDDLDAAKDAPAARSASAIRARARPRSAAPAGLRHRRLRQRLARLPRRSWTACRSTRSTRGSLAVAAARRQGTRRRCSRSSSRKSTWCGRPSSGCGLRAAGLLRPSRAVRRVLRPHLPHLDVLVNTIYWDERYPAPGHARVGAEQLRRGRHAAAAGHRRHQLRHRGQHRVHAEGHPAGRALLHLRPAERRRRSIGLRRDRAGGDGRGQPALRAAPRVLAALQPQPCATWSRRWRAADWSADFERLDLPPELKRAVIVHRGELTPDYRHLKDYLTIDPVHCTEPSAGTAAGRRRHAGGRMKKVLVLGAGLVAKPLVRYLLDKGYEVTVRQPHRLQGREADRRPSRTARPMSST